MDYHMIVEKLMPGVEFNPACFNFTEKEAREKKLWTDDRPMPTQSELEDGAELVLADENEKNTLKSNRLNLIKDKAANTKDRLDALVEHFGLDI